MDLDLQIKLLIENAPQDGVTPRVVAAIAPVLTALAQQVSHSQYYILQNLEQGWMVTTLANRTNPGIEKNVIYAYPRLQDVPVSSAAGIDPQIMAAPLPVTHILFQLVALENVDSIVFFDHPSDTTKGVEIRRDDLQKLIHSRLQAEPVKRDIPPDLA